MGVRIDPRAVTAELSRSAPMRRALRQAAEVVAADAERLTADPRRQIVVVERPDGARVVNTSPDAVREEWGSATEEPRAPLRRGVHAAGLRLDETH